jgi:endo-1,4-beta-D-glucanase Y
MKLLQTKETFFLLLYILSIGNLFGQNHPFPQNKDYGYGFYTTQITNEDINSWYQTWLNTHIYQCPEGDALVRYGRDNEAVSEGIGYGMLISAYFGNQALFDKLWAYGQRMMNSNNVLMWHTTCSGAYPAQWTEGAASDAEEDIALALLVAADQWGGGYKNDAIALITTMKNIYLANCPDGTIIFKPGTWGGCDDFHLDYIDPAHYRVFAEVTNDPIWNKLADDALTILKRNHHPTVFLPSEKSNYKGELLSIKQNYAAGPARIPWRVVKDYLWNNNQEAKTFAEGISNWANRTGYSNIKGEYDHNGNPLVTWSASWMKGGLMAAASANDQSLLDQFASHFRSNDLDMGYYNLELRILYSLTVTGNFWKPGTEVPTAIKLQQSDGLSKKVPFSSINFDLLGRRQGDH